MLLRIGAVVTLLLSLVTQGQWLKREAAVISDWGGYGIRFETTERRLNRFIDRLPAHGPIAYRSEVSLTTCDRDREAGYGFFLVQYLLAPRLVRWATPDDTVFIHESCDTLELRSISGNTPHKPL